MICHWEINLSGKIVSSQETVLSNLISKPEPAAQYQVTECIFSGVCGPLPLRANNLRLSESESVCYSTLPHDASIEKKLMSSAVLFGGCRFPAAQLLRR